MRLLLSLFTMLCFAGCASMRGGANESVDEVHLFGLPVTLNLDGEPGPDGFAARVYVTKGGSAKGARIQSGSLEVVMFDGVVRTDDLPTKMPDQTWKFTPRELNRRTEQTTLGQGYRFALRWDTPPKRGHITVVARYLPEKGQPTYSSPSTITAAVK